MATARPIQKARYMKRHVAENRRHWDASADQWVEMGERAWAASEPTWGIWAVPQADAPLLPDDMTGLRAIELGCGTGYVSAWMHRRGATVTAIDNSAKQLATAVRLASEHGITDIEWIHGNAEEVDKPDQSYDFAISEYGAAIWCDPRVWVPEAARLLRPGGRLVMLGNSPLAIVCIPPDGSATDHRLHRSYFELGEVDWTEAEVDPGGIEFNLPISAWFELFRSSGFTVENYLELRAPADASGIQYETPAVWARHYPSEQVWFVRRN